MSELQLQSGTPVFCGWIAGDAPRNDPLRIKLCGNGVNWTEGQVWRLTGGTGWPKKPYNAKKYNSGDDMIQGERRVLPASRQVLQCIH